ncbi:MAG: T9SS type A sorting domain-containing protein [bacterium]
MTHKPFLITLYAKDSQGNPLFLISDITLDDYTHTIFGSLSLNGTYTTGTATILQSPNKGLNRIIAITGTISGVSNQFITFANESSEHKIGIPSTVGTITIEIGSSTFGNDYYVDVDDNLSGIIELPEGNIGMGIGIEVSTSSGKIEGSLTFSFRVEIPYQEESLGDIDEKTLRLYAFKDNSWHLTRDSNVDTIRNIVFGLIDHLSIFAILGSKTNTPSYPLFWPNPYYADRHNKIVFSNEINEAFVYNLKGELIKEIKTHIWNNPENELPSGVYFIILKKGKKKYIRKLGIVR